jgi:hypothetical protein
MPTEAIFDTGAAADADATHRAWDRRAVRLGIGVTISFLIALNFDWTLGYLAPIFTAPLLTASEPPSPAATLRILVATFLIMLAFYLVGGFARAYPAFFMIALIPLLFTTFHYKVRGGSTLIVLLVLLGVMLVPMVAKISMDLAWDVAASTVWNIGLSVLVTHVMFAAIPPGLLPTPPPAKPVLAEAEVTRSAWVLTIITGSYAVAYFGFDWTNVHTPLYIAVFMQQLGLARGRTFAIGIIAANVAGGLIGWAMYELFVMTPYLPFVAILTLLIVLLIARMMTSGSPVAPLAGAALSVLMIVLGGAMVSFGDHEGAKITDRLGEIGMAAIYAVSALYVLDVMAPPRKTPLRDAVEAGRTEADVVAGTTLPSS